MKTNVKKLILVLLSGILVAASPVPTSTTLEAENPIALSYLGWKSQLVGKKGMILSAYSKPGLTWRDCRRDSSLCLGWPMISDGSKVQVLGTKYIKSSRLNRSLKYYKINVAYIPKGLMEYKVVKNAWIQARFVKKYKPTQPSTKARDKNLDEITQFIQVSKEKNLEKLTQQILPLIGECLVKKKRTKRQFTKVLRGHWDYKEETEDLQFSKSKLFAVDALARTLYGEMRGCHKKGLEYPRAVAKVALNRARAVQEKGTQRTKPFVRASLSNTQAMPMSDVLPYVLGSYKQFSTWNHWDRNLKNALCPGRWKVDKKAWKESVKVAVEAIFLSEQFTKRTDEIQSYHFTSGIRAPWRGFKRMQAKVDGKVLNSRACFQLWQKPKVL